MAHSCMSYRRNTLLKTLKKGKEIWLINLWSKRLFLNQVCSKLLTDIHIKIKQNFLFYPVALQVISCI